MRADRLRKNLCVFIVYRTSMEKDVDKMVHNLDADPHSLQSMQPLIQWVADIVLYVLASVPYHVSVCLWLLS